MEAATTTAAPAESDAVSSFARSPFLDDRMIAIAKLAYRRGEYGYAFLED